MRNIVLLVVLLLVSALPVALALPSCKQQDDPARSDYPELAIPVPEDLPRGMPDRFALLVQIARTIHCKAKAGDIASIRTTLLRHELQHDGVMEVRFRFSTLGGVTNTTVEINPYSAQRRVLGISTNPKTEEVVGFSQFNMLWDGGSDVDIKSGRIRSYRSGYMDFDESGTPIAMGRVGLQVEWSPEGKIIRQEYLEEREPFRLNKQAPQ